MSGVAGRAARPRASHQAAARPRRSIAIRPRAQYEALRERRQAETSPEYQIAYARWAGIEGTLSQGFRRSGLRQSRYVGLSKTQLGHVATAAALNVVRVGEWLAGTPRAKTRKSAFAVLMARAA
ncbi:MAG: transposase [Pyrinomonadaceae bacterium]|nr:transposase [Pyrinomonadaceae bacterium]